MAGVKLFIGVFMVACATAQLPTPGYFSVPASPFNRGGRVDFTGLSLGQICKQLMMLGGKEALSDGMGMAAKWLSTQKASSQIAGGADPQMQCLYSQATGAMMPGAVGMTDPGNMFGDYYDTVIEYPMILDPCTAPQCNGKVNPTVLLMQAFAPMMMRGGMGGGFGGGMPGAAGAGANPFAAMGQNPFLSAFMPQQYKAPAAQPAAQPVAANATAQTVGPNAGINAGTQAAPPQLPQGNPMANLPQNPNIMQMIQQIMQMYMRNPGQAAGNPNPGAGGFPGFSPFGSMFL